MTNMLYKLLYHQSVNPTLLKGIKWINAVIGTSVELPPSGVFTFNLPNKQKLLLATNQTCFMTKKIYWHGLGSFEYTNIFIDLAKNISCFLDIGANIGFYSLLIAAINKKASVVAFEPAFGPLHYVQWNVMLNEAADRIKVVDIALSNVEGEMEFFEQQNPKYPYLKHNLGGMSGVSPKFDQSSFKSKIVKTTTLDQFINDQKIEGIDLMKIDTEGSEHTILSSSSKTIEKNRPIIICETLFNKIEAELQEIMTDYGYLFFNHKDGKLVKTDSIIRETDDGIRDCFFVPEEKESLVAKYL